MDEQKAIPKPFFKRREVIFTSALLVLLAFLLLSSRMTGRPPLVESITPKIGFPRDVMVITGKYFGDERNGGEVVIGGYAPVSSGYLDWSDSRISLRIPEDVSSGMVRVITKNGERFKRIKPGLHRISQFAQHPASDFSQVFFIIQEQDMFRTLWQEFCFQSPDFSYPFLKAGKINIECGPLIQAGLEINGSAMTLYDAVDNR